MTNEVTIEDILASLDKDSLAMVKLAKDIEHKVIPTASIGLNKAIGGGLRVGKQHTFYGGEQSGKSALMLKTIALNQKLGVKCAWIDVEHSFDREWAEKMGVDVDKLIVSNAANVSGVTDLQIKLINLGIELLVIDSTSAIKPRSFYDKDGDLKGFDDTRQMGQHARDLGGMCSNVQSINFNCAVVHISQVRMDLGAPGMHAPMKPTGGKETGHTDQLRVRLTSSRSDKRAVMKKIPIGDSLVEMKVGRKVTWQVEKNKFNGEEAQGDYDLIVKGDEIGPDKASEIVALGISSGVIRKSGTWLYFFDEKFQGDEKAKAYLRENPEVMDTLEGEILAFSI